MSLLDLFVILVVLLFAQFTALPFGTGLFVVVALIIERLLVGERFGVRRP
jgi:hypothetical protein